MKIYIAHAFDARQRIKEWQESINMPQHQFINPFYDIERDDIEKIDNYEITREQIEDGSWIVEPEKIVDRDIDAIQSCDTIMVLFDNHKTIGTHMEVVYAYLEGLSVHAICEASEFHPWVQYHATTTFLSLDEYTEYLKEM